MTLHGAGQPAYQVVDPTTGEPVRSFPYATDTEVVEILDAAQSAYLDWRGRTVAARATLVRRAGAALLRRCRELAATMRLETGKPLSEGTDEIEYCASVFDPYADQGPALLADSARYFPAVLVDVTENMRAWHEELFGPVAVVHRVKDDQHAVDLANSTPYGLGAAVFSADPEQARRVAERLETGMANINTPSMDGPELPFGGVRRSDFGRELGPGVSEFMNKRLVCTAVRPHV
ncbi:aldehyde dehydrogenase family protein [Streptomyces sp. cg40]|uniref:aldehyde dehydrogenase family protein n=1 Tax=Streptomyces sp. cg40 TaxID=3419764 RepID=UPI003D09518C